MQIEKELSNIAPEEETLFNIGVFDGVHLGHQHLLSYLRNTAHKKGWLSGVLTFKCHPQTVLDPNHPVALLDDLDHRIELLRGMKIDIAAALSFTPEVSQLTPREFIVLLKKNLKIRGLIIGPDFALGKDREGNLQQL